MRSLLLAVSLALFSFSCHSPAPETKAGAAQAPQYEPLATFPPLGEAKVVERGIIVHEVALPHGRIWIYLPKKRPAKPIPAIFIAPAGVPPIVGNSYGPDLDRQKDPEHLPYVRAGLAVVAYDVDGQLPNPDDVTFEQVQTAATAFKNVEAGMVNARNAIDYTLKMVPAVDPQRLYSAGHSSAGRISLLLAETDPRIAACIAYAPVTDPERRAEKNVPDAVRYLQSNLPGFRDFLRRSSPIRNVERLRCPLFLFHAEDDSRIPIAESAAFAEAVKKTNPRVTFVRVPHGDHYDAMIEEGVGGAIRWLANLEGARN